MTYVRQYWTQGQAVHEGLFNHIELGLVDINSRAIVNDTPSMQTIYGGLYSAGSDIRAGGHVRADYDVLAARDVKAGASLMASANLYVEGNGHVQAGNRIWNDAYYGSDKHARVWRNSASPEYAFSNPGAVNIPLKTEYISQIAADGNNFFGLSDGSLLIKKAGVYFISVNYMVTIRMQTMTTGMYLQYMIPVFGVNINDNGNNVITRCYGGRADTENIPNQSINGRYAVNITSVFRAGVNSIIDVVFLGSAVSTSQYYDGIIYVAPYSAFNIMQLSNR